MIEIELFILLPHVPSGFISPGSDARWYYKSGDDYIVSASGGNGKNLNHTCFNDYDPNKHTTSLNKLGIIYE